MTRVHCKACGKRYDYESNGCCPECGAYNRPPRRQGVNADGTVYRISDRESLDADSPLHDRKQDKVCFESKECHEEKTCFEEQAQSVRGKMPQMPKIDLSALNGRARQAKKSAGPGKAFIVFFVIIALSMITNLLAERNDYSPEPDYSWEESYDEVSVVELNEYFTLDDRDIRITEWRIVDNELSFLIQGSEDMGAELRYWNEDGEYCSTYDFDVEYLSSGDLVLDKLIDGYAARYSCQLDGVQTLDMLMILGDSEAAVFYPMMNRAGLQESFIYEDSEIIVTDCSLERDGPSPVLEDLNVHVSLICPEEWEWQKMPVLWMGTDEEAFVELEPEHFSQSGENCELYYNLGRKLDREAENLTLCFPDCGNGAYWLDLN